MSISKPSIGTILEQYFEHIRHTENTRLWFANMYLLIVGSSFSISPDVLNVSKNTLDLLLFLFSLFGLFFSVKSARTSKKYTQKIYNILDMTFSEKQEREKYSVRRTRKGYWKFLTITNVYHCIFLTLTLFYGLSMICR